MSGVTVDYTIAMPGAILERGQATISGDFFSFEFDPEILNVTFPNLDLVSRDGLHYSRSMYALWVQLMLPEVRYRLGLEPVSSFPR